MKEKLKSLRLRLLLPVTVMTLRQEQEKNAAGFETVSSAVTPFMAAAITETRTIMADERIRSYIRLQYGPVSDLIHARIACRDYLHAEISRSEEIFGLLFMREGESIFGALPEGKFFLDDPGDNPLPRDIKVQIRGASRGQTVWAGPISGSVIYGFETPDTPQNLMAAAWKSVDVSYGECYAVVLLDVSVLARQFSSPERQRKHLAYLCRGRKGYLSYGRERLHRSGQADRPEQQRAGLPQ